MIPKSVLIKTNLGIAAPLGSVDNLRYLRLMTNEMGDYTLVTGAMVPGARK